MTLKQEALGTSAQVCQISAVSQDGQSIPAESIWARGIHQTTVPERRIHADHPHNTHTHLHIAAHTRVYRHHTLRPFVIHHSFMVQCHSKWSPVGKPLKKHEMCITMTHKLHLGLFYTLGDVVLFSVMCHLNIAFVLEVSPKIPQER